MNLNEMLNIKARNNPDSLLKLLLRAAIVSIIVVVIVSSYGFYRIFSGFVIKNAEKNSVQLCRVLIEQQKELLFVAAPGEKPQLGLHGTEVLAFDLNLRHYLAAFDIIKVKVYNHRSEIVYSTDPMLIGKVDQNNLRLKNALAGHVDAKMVYKNKARDLADEELMDVDVVETYVPIRSIDNRILGSFEVYVNITSYRDQIRTGAVVMTALLALVLVGVFGFSYILISGGTNQLKEAQSQLEIIAVTDTLTGIPNRGFLMTRGTQEFERIRRRPEAEKKSLGCIMLDLDYFKRVNDTYGHQAGDGVLQEMAARLKSSVRPYDIIGRYGGEEFVVLLPDTPFEQTLIVASRIRERVGGETFAVADVPLSVTVSLGVAVYNSGDRELSDIIKRADDGLYKAKTEGRDRVAWVTPAEEPSSGS